MAFLTQVSKKPTVGERKKWADRRWFLEIPMGYPDFLSWQDLCCSICYEVFSSLFAGFVY